ncbi:MAG: dihydroxyacetone kinase subunit DhaK [Spirochaetales bacterium]|nr:dihydroxyacetone kinase subunit DhaK [Spirochaetales bacterium]
MKKIINKPETVVDEMCEGIVSAFPGLLQLDAENRIISRKDIDAAKVNLISGGGSGHEPSHAGFVGTGMLDAAVCGDVFAAPSVIQILEAIKLVRSNKGVLLVVKNYSGDVMNFDGAAEMAEEDEDIRVEKVYVNDDVAVTNSLYTVGRRGVAGTVFVHKIAGALAEEGADLAAVKAMAEDVIANVRSMGVALTSCTVPAKGEPTFDITEGDMEFGVGIHGEPGVSREETVNAEILAKRITDRIIADIPFKAGDEVALLVNGLGGTPAMELFILNKEVQKILDKAGIGVYRTFVGNYMTSLDMAGASITLLRLSGEMKRLLDAPARTAALTI